MPRRDGEKRFASRTRKRRKRVMDARTSKKPTEQRPKERR